MASYYPWPNMILGDSNYQWHFHKTRLFPPLPIITMFQWIVFGTDFVTVLTEKVGTISWVHDEPSHWLHEISISKTVSYHHFLAWSNGWVSDLGTKSDTHAQRLWYGGAITCLFSCLLVCASLCICT